MMRRAFCFLAAVALLAPLAAISQEKKASTQAVEKRLKAVEKEKVSPAIEEAIHALNAASGFDQAAVSPDGKKVAWVEELSDKNGVDSGNSAIYIKGIHSEETAARVTAAIDGTRENIKYLPRAEGSVAWSPDSAKIVFLSDGVKPGQSQLYIKDLRDASIHRLTNVKGTL